MNWYAYVGNDPVNGVDPTGLTIKGLCVLGFDCRNALESDETSTTVDSVPAQWGELPKDSNGNSKNGSIVCGISCKKAQLDIDLAHSMMKGQIDKRQMEGLLIASSIMAVPALVESGLVMGYLAKENAATAIMVTQLFSATSSDLAVLTAHAFGRKEIPKVLVSLLKSGKWGKSYTRQLLPLKKN